MCNALIADRTACVMLARRVWSPRDCHSKRLVIILDTAAAPLRARWLEYHRVLGGLYRYAISRGFATTSPLPTDTPKLPPPLTPYIYSVDELKRLLLATDTLQTPKSPL